MDRHYKTESIKKCELEYAKAYIVPQRYENLFSMKDVLKTGTIFMDLYRPYVKKDDKSKYCKGERDE
ncbi:MAG: spore coat associated protein CotJA [Clostridium sp.]|nr:spore coat associated protein CotJA [Clostridium sp.]